MFILRCSFSILTKYFRCWLDISEDCIKFHPSKFGDQAYYGSPKKLPFTLNCSTFPPRLILTPPKYVDLHAFYWLLRIHFLWWELIAPIFLCQKEKHLSCSFWPDLTFEAILIWRSLLAKTLGKRQGVPIQIETEHKFFVQPYLWVLYPPKNATCIKSALPCSN